MALGNNTSPNCATPGLSGNRKGPIKGNVKGKVLPFGSKPIFFLGIQPNCLDVRSASSALWYPFRCRDGAHRFLKLQGGPLSTREWQCMVLSETLGLWLSSIVREGIGFVRRLACLQHGPDFSGCYFPSNRASQEPDGRRREWFPGIERTLRQRRSSCLWFQIVGVETYLLLPDDQRDRGNLPRQSQARQRGLPPLGE